MMPQRSVADYRRLLAADKNFIYLNRRAVPELVAAVNALGEPAIVFDREPERLYPQTDLAAHILGWTDYDGQGVAGLERVLNERSEEHTSELQSLMHISYADFSLKTND